MQDREFIAIGQIIKPHGVHGEFKVLPLTDFVDERFLNLRDFYILPREYGADSEAPPDNGGASHLKGDEKIAGPKATADNAPEMSGDAAMAAKAVRYEVSSVKMMPRYAIVGSPAISMEMVERLRGSFIYIRKEELMELPKDSFYTFQLVGMAVVDAETGERRGVIVDAYENVGNDMLEIRFDGVRNTVLVPFVREFVKRVDFGAGLVHVNVMEGLI